MALVNVCRAAFSMISCKPPSYLLQAARPRNLVYFSDWCDNGRQILPDVVWSGLTADSLSAGVPSTSCAFPFWKTLPSTAHFQSNPHHNQAAALPARTARSTAAAVVGPPL